MRPAAPVILVFGTLAALAHAGGDYALPALVVPPAPAPWDAFGSAVALVDRDHLAVGARGADTRASNAGAVDLFERDGEGWSFVERIAPQGLGAGDQFGESIACGGGWLAIGASRHDARGADAGAVWTYQADGQGGWIERGVLFPPEGSDGARFGGAMAVDGDTLVVGASSAAVGGMAFVFERVGDAWTAVASLSNPTPGPLNRFGDAVALSGEWLAVADPYDDAPGVNAGSVSLYRRGPKGWSVAQSIGAAVSVAGECFGQSIAFGDGRLAVGVYGADSSVDPKSGQSFTQSGRVDLFELAAGAWSATASIEPSEPVDGGQFGWQVAFDGGLLAVGAPGMGTPALSGAVSILRDDGSGGWERVIDLSLQGSAPQSVFGARVSLLDGRLAASAPGAQTVVGTTGAATAIDVRSDCNANGVLDEIEVLEGAPDCDGDGEPDDCETDANGDGVPDACGCRGDLNGDGFVSAGDFATLLTAWGTVGSDGGDLDGNGIVNAQDVALLLAAWGACD